MGGCLCTIWVTIESGGALRAPNAGPVSEMTDTLEFGRKFKRLAANSMLSTKDSGGCKLAPIGTFTLEEGAPVGTSFRATAVGDLGLGETEPEAVGDVGGVGVGVGMWGIGASMIFCFDIGWANLTFLLPLPDPLLGVPFLMLDFTFNNPCTCL